MQDFILFLNRMQLIDIALESNYFTCSNRRLNNNHIKRKLDRSLATIKWRDHYQEATLSTLYTIGSDHFPLLLQLCSEEKKNSPFIFEYMWIQHPDYFVNIQEWWNIQVKGIAMYRVFTKLQKLKSHLNTQNKENFRNVHERKVALQENMDIISKKIDIEGINAKNDMEEKVTLSKLYNTFDQEEIHWKQKSIIAWLKEGDKNTKFFKLTIVSRSYNRIIEIRKLDQDILKYNEEIKKEDVSFYENILSLDHVEDEQVMDEILEDIPAILGQQAINELERETSKDEIELAIFSMKFDKAPGPNGFLVGFYQK